MKTERYEMAGSLNELHAVSMILFLHENEWAYATDLRAVSGNYDGLKRLADHLIEDHLVQLEIEENPRVKLRYSLTDKGKDVAVKLWEIVWIMDPHATRTWATNEMALLSKSPRIGKLALERQEKEDPA